MGFLLKGYPKNRGSNGKWNGIWDDNRDLGFGG